MISKGKLRAFIQKKTNESMLGLSTKAMQHNSQMGQQVCKSSFKVFSVIGGHVTQHIFSFAIWEQFVHLKKWNTHFGGHIPFFKITTNPHPYTQRNATRSFLSNKNQCWVGIFFLRHSLIDFYKGFKMKSNLL